MNVATEEEEEMEIVEDQVRGSERRQEEEEEELDEDERVQKECGMWEKVTLKKESLIPHVIDEIALEGLDGITLQALKERLIRRPGLPVQITQKTMESVWNIIRLLHGIEFYLLHSPRPDLILFNRSDFVDERGIWYEPLSAPEDIYPYVPIHDQEKNIRGSCSTYKTRKPIPGIRLKSYAYVLNTYGNSLVIVACQKFRENALLVSEFSEGIEIFTDAQYGMLERIGRARYDGELTRGKVSLSSMKIEPKALFYHRKLLLHKELITKQLGTMKFGETRSSSLISILHLPRFHTRIEPPSLLSARKIIRYLRKKPKMREESAAIKKIFGKTLYNNLLSPTYSKVFKEESVSLAELFPELLAKEKKQSRKEALMKRTQKVLRYLNPPGDIESYLPVLKDEGDIHLGNPIDEKSNALLSENRGIRNRQSLNLFDTESHAVQNLIAHAGPEGISIPDIGETLQMLTLPARSAGRIACKLKFAKSAMVTYGKTKINKYIFCDKFPVENDESIVIKTTKKQPLPSKRQQQQHQKQHQQSPPSNEQLFVKSENGMDSNTFVSVKLISVTSPNDDDDDSSISNTNDRKIFTIDNENQQVLFIPTTTVTTIDNNTIHPLEDSNDSGEVYEELENDVDSVGGSLGKKFIRLASGGKRGVNTRVTTEPKKRKKPVRPPHKGVYYDEQDRVALSKKNTQRVNWSVDEDQHMLLLFISSVVFIRKYNLNKLFIFNATQIRDMLHTKCPISTNKTSLAIRRRLHFLIKNPTFKAKYHYYLHDAVSDSYVQEHFVDEFEKGLEDPQKIFHDVPTESILHVYDYLVQKYINYFTSNSNDNRFMLGGKLQTAPTYNAEMASDENYDDDYDDNDLCPSEFNEEGMENEDGVAPIYTKFPINVVKDWTKKPTQKVMVDAEWDAENIDEIEKWISRTVVFTLMFSGDALDDVQPFLGRIGDNNLEYVTNNFRKLNICTVSRKSHKFGLSTSMRRRLANHIQPESYMIANEFLNKVTKDYRATHPAVSNNSASLFLLTEFLIYNKVMFDISACKDWVKSNEEDSNHGSVSGNTAKKNRILGEDSFSVSLPVVKTKLTDDIETLVYGGPRPNGFADLTYLTNHLLKITPHDENNALDAMESPSRYLLLLNYIRQSEEVGVSMRLLLAKFTRSSLKNGLLYLLSTNQIYMVGIAQRKFVSVEHVLPWTVKIPTSSSDFDRKFHRVVIQPWVTSAGTMNWELVNVLFTSIIGILSNHPRIHIQHVIKFLNPVLSGVETMILIEALHHFELITMHKLIRSNKPALFSSPTSYYTDDDVDIFLDLEDVSIELKPFLTMKYVQLQEIFDSNFISRCKEYLLSTTENDS